MTTISPGVELPFVTRAGNIVIATVIEVAPGRSWDPTVSVRYVDIDGAEVSAPCVKGRETRADVNCYMIWAKRLNNRERHPHGRAAWIKDRYPCYTDTGEPICTEDMDEFKEAVIGER